jgi:hypothetical protein
MPYLRYLCLFAHSGVQHLLCCVFCFFSSACVPYVGMSHYYFLWNKGLIHTQCQKDTSTRILYHLIFLDKESPLIKYYIQSQVRTTHLKNLKIRKRNDIKFWKQ